MTTFVPENRHLREALLFMFNLKKTATEAHQMLAEAYGNLALSERMCREWFQRFKTGDFDVENKAHGRPPKTFEDDDLQALLDEDDAQTQEQLAKRLSVTRQAVSLRLHQMGKIHKEGKWVPYELTERHMERRKTTCEILLERQERKTFLHRMVTGDEKWIYFDNQKRKKSWTDPGQASKSTAKRNIHGKKVLLCIWWDQKGILYYELLKPGETVTVVRYQQQLMKVNHELLTKRPEWAKRHDKVILLHDNARPHVAKPIKDIISGLKWEVLPHPPYSPDIAPSDYHLFRSMAHGMSEQHFTKCDDIKKWLDDWIASKDPNFFFDGIHKLPKLWENVVISNGNYF
jgi:[histone H3]-lysine36 N-dimethyltransferase SETMAR